MKTQLDNSKKSNAFKQNYINGTGHRTNDTYMSYFYTQQ